MRPGNLSAKSDQIARLQHAQNGGLTIALQPIPARNTVSVRGIISAARRVG